MSTQFIQFPSDLPFPPPLLEVREDPAFLSLGPNDSSIQRGDREDTGDNEARPDEMGSGPAHPTADPTSFGATTSIRHPSSGEFDVEEELRDTDGLEVVEPTDARLGLTDIGEFPPDDWAADSGPTKTPEGEKN